MKKLIAFAVVLSAVFSLKAEYLLWQVDHGVSGSYNYIQLWGSTDSNATPLIGNSWTVIDGAQLASGQETVTLGNVGSNYQTYFVEYANYNSSNDSFTGSKGGYSATYSELSSSVWKSMTEIQGAVTAYTGGTYSSVPEPTSGLMLMLGLALMGLKRKRA